MYLGTRTIRSAGRSSGSVEITLPAGLQGLEKVECCLLLRDGPLPEIVLQPDLSEAHAALHELWQKLRFGLGEIGDIGDFAMAEFVIGLFPPHHWQERPPLAYADALLALQHRSGPRNGDQEALARLLASLAVTAGYRLSLEGRLALAFGDAVAYLITGVSPGLGTDAERGLAHRVFWGDGVLPQQLSSPWSDQVWQRSRTPFRHVYDQFRAWQENPTTYSEARDQWYRALQIEMGMSAAIAKESAGT